jgi:hypothetical protein
MAAESDNSENHWPGYVDALTTMTMVLTFVMMVLGISIFTMSQNVSRTLIEKIAKAAKVESESATPSSDDLTARIVAKLETLHERPPTEAPPGRREPVATTTAQPEALATRQERIASTAEASTEPAASDTRLSGDPGQLRIVYKSRATQIDEAAREKLIDHLRNAPRFSEASRIDVLAGVEAANLAVTDARRVAFYRAIRIRSELITQGAPVDRINLKLDPGIPADDLIIKIHP